MNNDQLIFIVSIFGVVAAITWALSAWLMKKTDTRLRDRLRNTDAPAAPIVTRGGGIGDVLSRIGQAAARPFETSDRQKLSDLRRKMARAGIYAPSAMRLFVGCRVIFGGLGIFGGYLVGAAVENVALGASLGGLVGYLLPNVWLKLQIKKQQQALDHALADALDLLVICVESGLTIDGAMQRVGQEIALAHPSLSKELEITHMETRVGLSRAEALKNLGTRTGNGALQNLGSMLIQAERFGTSIANALRVQSESLRLNRQHAAEELAAKATVKLSFPVVLFIFPAVLIVLAGPAVIGMFKSSLFE